MVKRRSLKESVELQRKRREETGKTDYVFLTQEKRRTRVCKTDLQCEFFLNKYLTLLNHTHKKGQKLAISLDVEGDAGREGQSQNLHYWARNLIGKSKAEIQSRKKNNADIDKTFKKLIKMSVDDDHGAAQLHWRWMEERRTVGVPHCDILAIQMACSADPKGDLVFTIQVKELIEESYKGQVKLPATMKAVLTHPAAIFVNVNQYEDIAKLIEMFYGGKLEGVRYVEMGNLCLAAWGPNWNGFDPSGKPNPRQEY
jgi:hypothetical protein